MSQPPTDPEARRIHMKWRVRVDEDISFDEVRRAVFGKRLRDDHSAILEDALTERMNDLLRALDAMEPDNRTGGRFQDRG